MDKAPAAHARHRGVAKNEKGRALVSEKARPLSPHANTELKLGTIRPNRSALIFAKDSQRRAAAFSNAQRYTLFFFGFCFSWALRILCLLCAIARRACGSTIYRPYAPSFLDHPLSGHTDLAC